jgi:hypothetical protein
MEKDPIFAFQHQFIPAVNNSHSTPAAPEGASAAPEGAPTASYVAPAASYVAPAAPYVAPAAPNKAPAAHPAQVGQPSEPSVRDGIAPCGKGSTSPTHAIRHRYQRLPGSRDLTQSGRHRPSHSTPPDRSDPFRPQDARQHGYQRNPCSSEPAVAPLPQFRLMGISTTDQSSES